MDKNTYLNLLDKVYEELPKEIHKKTRFEIPKVSGKFIKTRTLISNFSNIADIFSRDTNHFFRFFIKDLGIRGEIKNGSVILFSKFAVSHLNKTVEKYFKEFVECKNCQSPDTKLDGENLKVKCIACGYSFDIKKI